MTGGNIMSSARWNGEGPVLFTSAHPDPINTARTVFSLLAAVAIYQAWRDRSLKKIAYAIVLVLLVSLSFWVAAKP
jgi:hypothetical protein